MSARDRSPDLLHDRPISVAGIALPVPDASGALAYVPSSTPWLASMSDPTASTLPAGSLILGSGVPYYMASGIPTALSAYDAGVASLASADAGAGLVYTTAANTWARLTLAADKGIYATSASALSTFDLTSAGRALLDDANAAAQLATLGLHADAFIRATVSVADVTGGATDGPISVTAYRLDGTTPIASARQMMILAQSVQYSPRDIDTSVTFSAATVGTLIASGTGWAIIETTAAGLFTCTVSNSADETVYFSVSHPHSGLSDASKYAMVWSNVDGATWSA